MTDERFAELMHEAATHYHRPPDDPPLEAMWAAIEQMREKERRDTDQRLDMRPFLSERRKPSWYQRPALRMAAVLIVGLALGRLTASVGLSQAPQSAAVDGQESAQTASDARRGPYQSLTVDYLGETAALLVALPSELRSERTDSVFLERADELLLQTRLLLDSPAATDPALRALFEDLEVVLAHVVRLQADRDPTRIDLLNESLEVRDVMPRLRNAVVDHIAD
jgi:hypothetical protein